MEVLTTLWVGLEPADQAIVVPLALDTSWEAWDPCCCEPLDCESCTAVAAYITDYPRLGARPFHVRWHASRSIDYIPRTAICQEVVAALVRSRRGNR